MKKKLLFILIIVAIGIYGWNARLLLVMFQPEVTSSKPDVKSKKKRAEFEFVIPQDLAFIEKGKSPFVAYKSEPRAASVKQPVDLKKSGSGAKPQQEMPKIAITGIVWNPSNPLVMLQLPDGSSTVAKAGQDLGNGVVVKKIEEKRIQVEFEKKKYWIDK